MRAFKKKNTTEKKIPNSSMNTERSTRGFSLVELLLVVLLIGVLTALVLVNYSSFGSRSALVVRLTEIEDYVHFAQERSLSAEPLTIGGDTTTEGYQVLQLKVRHGVLDSFFLKKKVGRSDSLTNLGENLTADDNATGVSELSSLENYFVDACFINLTEGAPVYVRKALISTNDCTAENPTDPFPMLCAEQDPLSNTFDEDVVEKNDFDIILTIEQPTREVYANLIPMWSEDTFSYANAQPAGNGGITDTEHKGFRLVLITPNGIKRSLDFYRLGLITTQSKDSEDGCGNATLVTSET